LQSLVKKGHVKVSGKLAKSVHLEMEEDAKIECDFPTAKKTKIKLGKNPFKVLFEDENLIAIDKPAGITVHPPSPELTIVEILGCEDSYLKPIHRLDRDTSGVLLFAKSEKAHFACAQQWKEREVKKTYITLVKGVFDAKNGVIEAAIARSDKDRRKMAVSLKKGSRPSITDFQVIETFDDCTLVKVFPKTGRTHQIRVHFASIGHAVLGDSVYGDEKLNKKFRQKLGLTRQFLHAAELVLKNPQTGKNLKITSELPKDLSVVLEAVRLR